MKIYQWTVSLTLVGLFIAGCTMFGDRTPQEIAEANVQRELGWNKVMVLYNTEIKKCTPVKTAQCVITVDQASTAVQAIQAYQTARTTCLTEGGCNACTLATSVGSIAAVVGQSSLINMDAVCAGSVEIDDIIAELEAAPDVIGEEE